MRAHERRNLVEARQLRRPPAPLARDQLVGPAGHGPDQHRLQYAAFAQRVGEADERAFRELLARLGWFGCAELARYAPQLCLLGFWSRRHAGRAQYRREAAAHAAHG